MYKWILFDADGTLFDYDSAEFLALTAVFEAFGVDRGHRHVERYRKINAGLFLQMEQGRIAPEQLKTRRFEILFSEIGVDLNAVAFSRQYLSNLSRLAMLVPGALETVEALHGEFGLLVVTNGLAEVQRKRFWSSVISPFFHDIVISEEVGAAKPCPEIFDYAFEVIGRPRKERVLLVGDSLTSDMRGGIDYGIDTCWFNPKDKADPDGLAITHEIRELTDLVDILKPR